MRARSHLLVSFFTCLLIAQPARAQEGHPLKGSWLGDWGTGPAQRTPVFILLDWDGKDITGTINPGPNAVPIQKAVLEIQKGTPPTAPARGTPPPAAPQGPANVPGTQQRGAPQGPPPPPDIWLVHIEAEGKDQTGKPIRYMIDGRIENLGLANRSLVGTWVQGTTKGDFRIKRQ
jgi:hypothetical protein